MKLGRPILVALTVVVILLAANNGLNGMARVNSGLLWGFFVVQFITMAMVWGGGRWGMPGGRRGGIR